MCFFNAVSIFRNIRRYLCKKSFKERTDKKALENILTKFQKFQCLTLICNPPYHEILT